MDQKQVRADGQDVTLLRVEYVDYTGVLVPSADNNVSFVVSGPATIIGVGIGVVWLTVEQSPVEDGGVGRFYWNPDRRGRVSPLLGEFTRRPFLKLSRQKLRQLQSGRRPPVLLGLKALCPLSAPCL